VLSGLPLTGLYYENVDMNRCNSTGFGQLSSFSIVCLIPIVVTLCGGQSRLISVYSLVQVTACWTAQLLSAFQGLCGRELYVRAVQTGRAIRMQEFTADLKHRMRGVWRDAESVDPNTHNNKLATYHSWFAIPFSRNERMPTIVPRYLHLDLSKHVMRNVSRLRLRAHSLKVEAAAWLEDGSRVCDQCPGEDEHVQNEMHALLFCQDHRVCELRKHFSFLFTPFFKDFPAAQPFLLQQVNNQLVHDLLSQQNTRLFLFLSELMDLFVAVRDQSAADQPNNLAEGHPPL